MSTIPVNSDVRLITLAAEVGLTVGRRGYVFSAGNDRYAVLGEHSGHDLHIAGGVVGDFGGIKLKHDAGLNAQGSNNITITSTGYIGATEQGHGILIAGFNNSIFNSGSIEPANGNGIVVEGQSIIVNAGRIAGIIGIELENALNLSSLDEIYNSGIIFGRLTAIVLDERVGPLLTNQGDIVGGSIAISGNDIEDAGRIMNTGLIQGSQFSIVLDNDGGNPVYGHTIANSGLIIGDISLSEGNDRYDGRGGVVKGDILGNAGDDLLIGGDDEDLMRGGDGADDIRGRGGIDEIYGDDGDDVLSGQDGDDVIEGGLGNDTLSGGRGIDLPNGGEGNDVMRGGQGDDEISGDIGNDLIRGDKGEDELFGNAGDDTVRGGLGDDTIFGGTGKDFLTGDGGNDFLRGGNQNDRIDG
ncbi:MAG: calcium-binding protein [Pseudomonadota bacterium]